MEKLFHLNVKIAGDAKEIVSKAPLANDDIVWTALCHRFDNKRMLINAQPRTLFMLPFILTASAEGIKSLQNGVNNSVAALQFEFDKFLTARYQTIETVADLRASSSFHLQTDFHSYQYNNETNHS